MKFHRILLAVVVMSLSTLAFAQTDAPKPSEAKKSFDKMKTLAGSWEGPVTTNPAQPELNGKISDITLRVTSMGNALMHEMRQSGRPDDPITMFYLDGDQLYLTHYCDAGNRPRMAGKLMPDGKTVEFEFVDVTGNMRYGHMHHAVITVIDENHHTEDWTFMVGDNPVQAHFDLQRKN